MSISRKHDESGRHIQFGKAGMLIGDAGSHDLAFTQLCVLAVDASDRCTYEDNAQVLVPSVAFVKQTSREDERGAEVVGVAPFAVHQLDEVKRLVSHSLAQSCFTALESRLVQRL